MEQNEKQLPEEEAVKTPEEGRYIPRPRWQIALAWIALIGFIVGVILYQYHFFINL